MFLLVLPLWTFDLQSVFNDKWVFLLSCGVMPPLIFVMGMSIDGTQWRGHLTTLVREWYFCSWSKWYSADISADMNMCNTYRNKTSEIIFVKILKKMEKLQLNLICVCFKKGMEYWKNQFKENKKGGFN